MSKKKIDQNIISYTIFNLYILFIENIKFTQLHKSEEGSRSLFVSQNKKEKSLGPVLQNVI